MINIDNLVDYTDINFKTFANNIDHFMKELKFLDNYHICNFSNKSFLTILDPRFRFALWSKDEKTYKDVPIYIFDGITQFKNRVKIYLAFEYYIAKDIPNFVLKNIFEVPNILNCERNVKKYTVFLLHSIRGFLNFCNTDIFYIDNDELKKNPYVNLIDVIENHKFEFWWKCNPNVEHVSIKTNTNLSKNYVNLHFLKSEEERIYSARLVHIETIDITDLFFKIFSVKPSKFYNSFEKLKDLLVISDDFINLLNI